MFMSIDYYNNNALDYFDKTVAIDMSALYALFLKRLPERSHILDAGCGVGRDSKHFIDLGYKVTSIDASEEMVNISSKFTGQQTLLMTFQDMSFVNCFDGIWASASLLHIPRQEMNRVFNKFIQALKDRGTWYLSFKVGSGERIQEDGRFFNDYDEVAFRHFLSSYDQVLNILSITSSVTNKDNCLPEEWLNILLQVDKSKVLGFEGNHAFPSDAPILPEVNHIRL